VIEKIVESGLKTYFKEVSLVDQPFVHDSSKTVTQAVNEAAKACWRTDHAQGLRCDLHSGEGIEKETHGLRRRSGSRRRGRSPSGDSALMAMAVMARDQGGASRLFHESDACDPAPDWRQK